MPPIDCNDCRLTTVRPFQRHSGHLSRRFGSRTGVYGGTPAATSIAALSSSVWAAAALDVDEVVAAEVADVAAPNHR
jgi:hypothetical protein